MNVSLPRSTPKQRLPLYEDVETLISPGFLTHSVSVGSVKLAVRSLGPGDLFLLRSRVGYGSDNEWKMWALASAVWVVNGAVVLGEANAATAIIPVLRNLPSEAIAKLFSVLLGLFARQTKALHAVESFCYEGSSRYIWKSYGGHHPTAHSGIEGASTLGSNGVQRMWAFFNSVEDQRLRDETMWEGFKLTTSAQAPKGVKKIDERDKRTHQQEQDRRQELQDRFYYETLGLIKPKGEETDGDAPVAKLGSKSPDDLADEMYRWVVGDEDQHDAIVNAYKKQVTERYEQEKRVRAERRRAIQERELGTGSEDSPMALVGYTPEQLQEILKGRGAGAPGVKQIMDEGGSRDYLYNRYLERDHDSGVLKPESGRLEPAEGRDLTETLANRRVPFTTEETES